jgi:hypothetical protein
MYPSAAEFRQVNAGGPYEPFVWHEGKLIQVAFAPYAGSQSAFLADISFERLLHGNRGGGKSKIILADFVQHVGRKFGPAYKGIVFKRNAQSFKELKALARELFTRVFPNAKENVMFSYWEFPEGERLYFGYLEKPEDYWSTYHGSAFCKIYFDELTEWPNPECYLLAQSLIRSTHPGTPLGIAATTNPGGTGNGWVKTRFRLRGADSPTVGLLIDDAVDDNGNRQPPRRAFCSRLSENILSCATNPRYLEQIVASAGYNDNRLRAWRDGDWDVSDSGIFADVWQAARLHCVWPDFIIPATWRMYHSFDYGSARPFSYGVYALSDGCDVDLPNGHARSTVPGDVFRCGELYGMINGQPDKGLQLTIPQIGTRIKRFLTLHGWDKRVRTGPADHQIFAPMLDMGPSIYADFEKLGVYFEAADKSPGSRIRGIEQIRKLLAATIPVDRRREESGLFIFESCSNFLRTIPDLPRDKTNIEDYDKNAEGHIADEVRYMLTYDITPAFTSRRIGGA